MYQYYNPTYALIIGGPHHGEHFWISNPAYPVTFVAPPTNIRYIKDTDLSPYELNVKFIAITPVWAGIYGWLLVWPKEDQ